MILCLKVCGLHLVGHGFACQHEQIPTASRCCIYTLLHARTQQVLDASTTSERHCILIENENQADAKCNVAFWLRNLKNKTNYQHQLMSVLDINLTLTLDVEFALNYGHLTSQLKFNQISMFYDVVCLMGSIIIDQYLKQMDMKKCINHKYFIILKQMYIDILALTVFIVILQGFDCMQLKKNVKTQ